MLPGEPDAPLLQRATLGRNDGDAEGHRLGGPARDLGRVRRHRNDACARAPVRVQVSVRGREPLAAQGAGVAAVEEEDHGVAAQGRERERAAAAVHAAQRRREGELVGPTGVARAGAASARARSSEWPTPQEAAARSSSDSEGVKRIPFPTLPRAVRGSVVLRVKLRAR